jgi:hypothetical protein
LQDFFDDCFSQQFAHYLEAGGVGVAANPESSMAMVVKRQPAAISRRDSRSRGK